MVTYVDCEQGSEAWFRARMGIPTASEFSTVLAKGKGGGESVGRRKYLYQLASEIVSGEPAETFSNSHMDRGKAMEAEARAKYAFEYQADPVRVGFAKNGKAGCSPDSLIAATGGLEIKTKLPALVVECIIADRIPPEHVAQLQGFLWVCEREWIDLAVYWPRFFFVKRMFRDEAYIGALSSAVDEFNEDLAAVVEKVRRYMEAA